LPSGGGQVELSLWGFEKSGGAEKKPLQIQHGLLKKFVNGSAGKKM
jgi:hypothetical protein